MPRTEHQLADSAYVKAQRKKFSDDLRKWRAERGLTLAEAGNFFGVSRGLIQALEDGRSAPSFAFAVNACREMGTTVPSFAK